MKKPHNFFAAAIVLLLAVSAHAADDKDNYTLFNPTPRDKMRELATDRPDKTESPYTVDAGHFQLEMDFITYRYNKDNTNGADSRVRSFNAPLPNIKFGVTNSSDIQFVLDGYYYEHENDRTTATKETNDGFGDVTVRFKQNIWGNDGGKTALALLPFVKIPTNSGEVGNNSFEGGLAVPYATELPNGMGLGLMAQVNADRDEDNQGYHATYIGSASVGFDLTDKLGQYVELYGEKSAESGSEFIATIDSGLTYLLVDNVQLDAGVNIGLTKAADNINPFIGISYRY